MKITHRIYFGPNVGPNFPFVASRYSGTVTCYLEAKIKATSGTYVIQITADGTQKATISTTNTNYENVRSSGWTQSADAIISTSWVSGSGGYLGVQLVIIQDTGDANALTATSHAWHWPIAGGYTSSTTAVEPSSRTYWKYTSADFDGTVSVRAECEYYTSGSKGTVTIIVQEDDGTLTTWSTKVTVVAGGTALSYTRVGANFTPVNGRTYRFVYYISSNKYYAYMRYGQFIINQTGAAITKTVALAPSLDYSLGSVDPYSIYSFWDQPNDFSQCLRASRIRVYASAAVTQSCAFDALDGGSWTQFQSVSTGSIGWFDAGSDASIPDTATQIRGYMTSNYSFVGHLVHRLQRTTYTVKSYTSTGYIRATGPSTGRTYSKTKACQIAGAGVYADGHAPSWKGNINWQAGYRGILGDWLGGIDPRGQYIGDWEWVATGGVYLAGVGARSHQRIYKTIPGGVWAGGAAAKLQIKNPHPGGGLYSVGAAVIIKEKNVLPKGAYAFWADGLAQVALLGVKMYMASGYARLTGAAAIQKEKYESAVGGVYLAGQAAIPRSKVTPGSGGLYTAGSAGRLKIKDIHEPGIVILTGPAKSPTAKEWGRIASGGLYSVGAAGIIKIKDTRTPAKVWLDGLCSSLQCVVRTYNGSGSVWLVGDGITFKIKEFIVTGSGGLYVSGDAYYKKNFYHATGGLYLDGKGVGRVIFSIPPPGMGNTEIKSSYHLHNRTWMFKIGDWYPQSPIVFTGSEEP